MKKTLLFISAAMVMVGCGKKAQESEKTATDTVEIVEEVTVQTGNTAGAYFTDFTGVTPEGKELSLSELVGKTDYVLVDFWASWCGPCRRENPNVVRLYERFHDQGFEIYSVSLDKDREAWLKAIRDDRLSWPNHVSDLNGWTSSGGKTYGIRSVPSTVLVDREGKVVARNLRGSDLERKLEQLLEQ